MNIYDKMIIAWENIVIKAQETIEFQQTKIADLQKQVGDSRTHAQSLAACLAEKDSVLNASKSFMESLDYEESHRDWWIYECQKALALNPNQYQERVKARDRVIEAARNFNFILKEEDKTGLSPFVDYEDAKELSDAFAELDKLEGDSSKDDPHTGRTDSCL
jgi:hypothetical protein